MEVRWQYANRIDSGMTRSLFIRVDSTLPQHIGITFLIDSPKLIPDKMWSRFIHHSKLLHGGGPVHFAAFLLRLRPSCACVCRARSFTVSSFHGVVYERVVSNHVSAVMLLTPVRINGSLKRLGLAAVTIYHWTSHVSITCSTVSVSCRSCIILHFIELLDL